MNSTQQRDRADRLRHIPLTSVLQMSGATRDLFDPKKWHTSQGGVSITGMKFFNWNKDCGGGGAIDLVIHLQQSDFKHAIAWLSSHFPQNPPPPMPQPPSASQLKLPAPCPRHINRIVKYLHTSRHIPSDLILHCIQNKNLYADSHANAVFIMRDSHNQPIGAELRGTGTIPWRGLAPGSCKNLGYFAIGPSTHNDIILCESAIDALSCSTLHQKSLCISTAGARPNPPWLHHMLKTDIPIFCGFDNDTTGNALARHMTSIHPSIQRIVPTKKDWNDMLSTSS